jgi:phage terminase large subunit
MMPSEFIKDVQKQKNYVDLVNGHRILFRPLDDEGKARSLNLCYFWIEEASEIAYDYFVQLQTRLRNHATTKHRGILSSNPELNWIRNEFLLKSHRIYNAERKYHIEEVNPNFSTHIAPTRLNTYLPPTFREDVSRGKPFWWTARYLDGSFEFSDGAVYPSFSQHIVEHFDIPDHWERLAGADFGLRDPSVMLMAAIDPKDGVVYIYKEHYENDKPVPHHAKKMRAMLDDVPLGLLRQPVADPSGKKQNINDRRSLFDHYAEYGIFFKPGNNRIRDGIMKVYSYFELGRLKIFNTCTNTIREGINYKYETQELDSKKNFNENPIDKENHAMDTIRYIIQELPDNPDTLKNKSYGLNDINYGKIKSETVPFELQEEESSDSSDWYEHY